MKSTLKSEKILEIKNFSASYSVPIYKSQTLRDLFIQTISHPIETLLKDDDRITLLNEISFDLNKGERLGILGNNGSGKTTLCRYIAGVFGQHPKIQVKGKVRSIFDTEVSILPELSGRENIEILTQLFYPELSKSEKKDIASESLEFSDIGKFADAPYKLYSKGMRARLCLSLISAREADLLILDEVFNGADYFFSEKITKRVKELIYKSGAVIFISHSQDLLEEVCNRSIVINDKKIVFDGDPKAGRQFYLDNCNQTKIVNG